MHRRAPPRTFAGSGFRLEAFIGPPQELIQSTKLFARGGGPEQFPPFAVEAEGQVLDWGFETAGGEQLLGRGDVLLDGMNATNVDFVGWMRFDAVPTPLLSPDGSGDFEYMAPFFFEAMIRSVQGGEELFAREFVGRGRLSVNYEAATRPGHFGFEDSKIPYEFFDAEPIPEPATFLLLGSGLAAGVLRRRRRSA
ncbi:MAG TPA: PEP-CTERM sorting domain-containing protein [Vicinamibacterales bacterium]|nr:PEP-CTERM sorting domain-containing protein [Vicinamibacterales bacterium]